MLHDAIITAYKEKIKRDWDSIYFAVDLHGTIIERYTGSGIKPYGHALDVLHALSSMPDIVLILFTSTSKENLKSFYEWCDSKGILFKYLNENPECINNTTGDFTSKFYYNVLIDDRAGFDPELDWIAVKETVDLAKKMEHCKYIETCKNSLKHKGTSNVCRTCCANAYFCYDQVS
jgi:hypothetical protein